MHLRFIFVSRQPVVVAVPIVVPNLGNFNLGQNQYMAISNGFAIRRFGLISAVGGLDNIKKIYSTPTKIILQPEDNSLLNFKLMQKQGVYKVVETRTTYDLSYGAISFLVVKEVEKRLGQS